MKICSQCGTAGQPDSRFCAGCGAGLSLTARKNTISTPIGILLAVLAVCGFCGVFAAIIGISGISKSGESYSVNAANKEPKPENDRLRGLTSTPPVNPATDDNSLAGEIPGKKSTEENDAKKVYRRGIVISETANLRRTASQNGEVVAELPEDTDIEVIRQKGAWFFVQAEEQTGWLHGNSFRLNDNPADEISIVPSTDYSPSPSSMPGSHSSKTRPTPKPVIMPSVPSGATAKCRDGTLSYSAHRRGTCSHHGGVSVWY